MGLILLQTLKKEKQVNPETEAINQEKIHVTDSQKKEYRESAIQLLQQELLLDQLATNLNIQVDESELNAEVDNLVRIMGETDAQKIQWKKIKQRKRQQQLRRCPSTA